MVSKKDLKQKPIIFNVQDPYQLKLLKHAEQHPNFSGYMKRLIQRDMEGGTAALERSDFASIEAKDFL